MFFSFEFGDGLGADHAAVGDEDADGAFLVRGNARVAGGVHDVVVEQFIGTRGPGNPGEVVGDDAPVVHRHVPCPFAMKGTVMRVLTEQLKEERVDLATHVGQLRESIRHKADGHRKLQAKWPALGQLVQTGAGVVVYSGPKVLRQ